MKTYAFKLIGIIILFSVFAYPVNITYSQSDNYQYLPTIDKCSGLDSPVTNGNFEQGTAGWTFDPWGMASVERAIYGYKPIQGNWMVFLPSAIYGGLYPSIQQSVTIPASHPYLSFWWSAHTSCGPISGDRCASFLEIGIDNHPYTASYGEMTQPWHSSTVDLSAYAGQTVLLSFVNANYRDITLIVLDDITFQSCP